MCGTCDADASNDCVQDCAGVWGGTSIDDDCGICGHLETIVLVQMNAESLTEIILSVV